MASIFPQTTKLFGKYAIKLFCRVARSAKSAEVGRGEEQAGANKVKPKAGLDMCGKEKQSVGKM